MKHLSMRRETFDFCNVWKLNGRILSGWEQKNQTISRLNRDNKCSLETKKFCFCSYLWFFLLNVKYHMLVCTIFGTKLQISGDASLICEILFQVLLLFKLISSYFFLLRSFFPTSSLLQINQILYASFLNMPGFSSHVIPREKRITCYYHTKSVSVYLFLWNTFYFKNKK